MSENDTRPNPFCQEVFIKVTEDWYSNFKIANDGRYLDTKLVALSLRELFPSGMWQVCIWGNDDFGLEKDFPADESSAAMLLFTTIALTRFPTQEWFHSLGMVHA